MRHISKRDNQGFILVTLLISILLIVAIGTVTTQLVISNLQQANVERYRVNAQFAADSGLDKAIVEINQDPTWTGTSGEETLYENDLFKTTYEVNVDEIDEQNKVITATGNTYAPKTSSTPRSSRTYEVALRGIGGENYSVVTGVGGLILRNNAKILDGNIFVNGKIQMFNSSQIGMDLLGIPVIPVPVRVAHHSCPVPANASYPRLCAPGEDGEPISLNHSAKIYGEVKANNQTTGTNMLAPGLTAGSVSPTEMPEYDRSAHAVSSTRSGGNACGSLLGVPLPGVVNWPANVKINGNVTIPTGCIVNVQGDVWITGNLNIPVGGIMVVNPSLNTSPVIMIDGNGGLNMNGGTITPSSHSKGVRFITFRNATGDPDAEPTGADLYDSQSMQTIHVNGLALAPHSEFYARWSKVVISNALSIGAVAGQTVEVRNSVSVTFGARVTGFSAQKVWVVQSYKRVFE